MAAQNKVGGGIRFSPEIRNRYISQEPYCSYRSSKEEFFLMQ